MKLFTARRAPRAYMAPAPNVVMPASRVVEPDGDRPDTDPFPAGRDATDQAGRARRRGAVLSVEGHRLVIVLSRGGEPIACLARRFPHVVNDLASRWREPASVVHRIDELLVDRRGGRRGFPADALAELLALRRAALKRSVSPASAAAAPAGAKG
jgi:hypothetical protein